MSSPILDSTFFYSTPETFPATIADNNLVQHSLTPRHHVKHPKWYFDDADLFFTQRGILFGLHQHKFNNPHFSRRLNHIKPCRTAAKGTISSDGHGFTHPHGIAGAGVTGAGAGE